MLIQLSVIHTLFRQGHVPLQIRFERDDVVVSLCKRFCNTTADRARDTRRSRAVPCCVAVRSAIVPVIARSKPTMHLIICSSHLCDQGSHGVLGGDATLLHRPNHLPDRSLFCRELLVEIVFYQRSFDVFMSFFANFYRERS